MSTTIASTEAKAKLSEILDRVVKGEEFIITRHDEMIARLIPIHRPSLEQTRQVIEQLKSARKGVHATLDELLAWKDEARR